MSGLARSRHSVEAPFAVAGRGVVSVDEPAHSVLAAGNANDDKVFHRERRDGEAVALLVFGRYNIPNRTPGLGVERDHVRIERPQKNLIAQNREPAIHAPTAGTNVPRQLMLKHPDGPPCSRIQSKGTVILRRSVENPVHYQRRSLELARRTGLVDPLRHQRTRIRDVDLIESAEAPARVIARIGEPILRFLPGIQ